MNPAPSHRGSRAVEFLAHLAAEYLARESNRMPMITVTRADLSNDRKRATIYVSIFPDEQIPQALEYLARQDKHLRDFLATKSKWRMLPVLSFALDEGERSRQRLDKLS